MPLTLTLTLTLTLALTLALALALTLLKAHSGELDQLINADDFAATLASPAYLGTTVS